MARRSETSQLDVARIAADLILRCGIQGTTGHAIAEAAGISERTLWRHFRTKEDSIAPLFDAVWQQYVADFRSWPRDLPIEAHLARCFDLRSMTAQHQADGVLVVRLIALLPEAPDLRAVWLMSYHRGEADMRAIIADRLGRAHQDFEVRLCAAAVVAAIRTIDETISLAAVRDGQTFTLAEIVGQMARALRAVSNLPWCDPVPVNAFGTAVLQPA